MSPKLQEIEDTVYFKSLSVAEQKKLRETFAKWPTKEQAEFIAGIKWMQTDDEAGQLIEQMEATMKDLEASGIVASKEEEDYEKTEEMKDAEAMLSEL